MWISEINLDIIVSPSRLNLVNFETGNNWLEFKYNLSNNVITLIIL